MFLWGIKSKKTNTTIQMKTNKTTLIPYDKPKRCKYSEEGMWELMGDKSNIKTYNFRLQKKGYVIGERTFKDIDETMYVVRWDTVKTPQNIAKDYIEII